MGSLASTLASEESKEADYVPHPTDVFTLANKIIDDAQYWSVVSCSAKPGWTIAQNHGPRCCLVTPRLDSLILEESFKVRMVRFVIASHDQGWASENSFPTQYMGSWTWFEAGIVRSPEGDENPEDEESRILRINELLKSQGSESGPDRTMVKNPEKDSYVWHIQRNILVWTDSDLEEEVDEREFMDMTGAGRGKDSIVVIARARFPGWTNDIASVEVKISYSV
ncbi:hypothetical protein CPB84DRAFT_1784583 [Gymnopilus junonius]|uniref:Uncharacterized protein n=1 Tax=Gymnopilus junonius TaxID=109634 RepID=A0A9P5NGZ4_GYMJU|nr:hypothetical protein CPB84DRAFT_1784583 [Gymnopilus junonius]